MSRRRQKRSEQTAEAGGQWESTCRQCGFCCFEKYENDNGAIFYTQTPCRYLDVVTRRCKVYKNRFTINPECIQLTPELVQSLKWLHPECGYRQAQNTDSNKQR